MGEPIITALSSAIGGGGGGAGNFKGFWDASNNTPTLADGVGVAGDYYICSVGGTQNLGSGPITCTSGDEMHYDGAIWFKVDRAGDFWERVSGDLQPKTNGDNVNLRNGGLKDTNVTTSVKLGSVTDTSFNTTKKDIIGAVNETLSTIPVRVVDSGDPTSSNYHAGLAVTSPGQTAFTISTSATSIDLYLNGVFVPDTQYTLAGTSLTWSGITLQVPPGSSQPDTFDAIYNDGSIGAAPVTSVFSRTGAVVAATSDYDASQVDNDSGVSGATVKDALDQLDSDIPTIPVTSVFGRTGAIVAAVNDYDASEVNNDSDVSGATVKDALNQLLQPDIIQIQVFN
jgi:hypothetical protein